MKRLQTVLLYFAVLAGAWAALFFNALDSFIPPQHLKQVHEIAPALPGYGLIVFGCYALYNVGSALFSFADCPEAAASLKKDIEEAQARLKQKGFVQEAKKAQ